MDSKCTKCNSENIFTKKSDNNTGLYCSECDVFLKWLNKDAVRTFGHKSTSLPETKCEIPMPSVIKPKTNYRKCKGLYFDLGYFHQWISGTNSTVLAVIELPDGKIVTPLAKDIQFIDTLGE